MKLTKSEIAHFNELQQETGMNRSDLLSYLVSKGLKYHLESEIEDWKKTSIN